MDLFTIYLLTRLTALNDFLCMLGALSGVGFVVSMFLTAMFSDIDRSLVSRSVWYAKLAAIVFFTVMSLKVFMPTAKEAFLIIGGAAVINNAEIQKLPDNVAKAANSFLEEYINESKPKN